MSKTKTKRARREAKREESRKVAAHHRKAASAATSQPTTTTKPHPPTRRKTSPKAPADTAPAASIPPKHGVQASQRHVPPFDPYDRILLVGEGDFSFARCLALELGCADVTATSFDSAASVREKYPRFAEIAGELAELVPPVPLHHDVDATKLSSYKFLRHTPGEEGGGGGGGQEEGRPEGVWDKVAFMFPHTGGLSTDVNRQVRANQALLVGFFKSCLEVAEEKKPVAKAAVTTTNIPGPVQVRQKQKPKPFLRPGGRVYVTLFEGEPYTLWNVRDLARHAGLKVVESGRFDWEKYPGYGHVRTLGHIEGGGAWKGEDRAARMYVFEKEAKEEKSEGHKGKGKKRAREESDEDEEG